MSAGEHSHGHSARWARIEALFHEAVELSDSEQRAFLGRACEGDDDLRVAVSRLLGADRTTGSVLDRHLDEVASPLLRDDLREELDAQTPPLAPGTLIGPYRIVGVLGTGGMGAVYRAERADGAYERQVAVKLVQSGRLRSVAPFRRERQILARLNDPGIATLLDGGTTDEGVPFLVMELVEGRAITDYARAKNLGVRDRLKLVLEVTRAVDYAHRNLVVHRDLKPSNILVRESGAVKLLDFGIARLLEEDPDERATRTGLFLTPGYAAPEQIRGEAVTTATDVYGIGMVLYELLARRHPFGRVTSSWNDLERVLDETPPPVSRSEKLDRRTRRALEGDLDTIVQKALHKDPQRRYDSARALGEDIAHHMGGRPVTARPDALGYKLSKFVRRNRAVSIVTVALLAAIVLGVAGTLWQARNARVQAQRREAVGDFLFSLFDGADPDLNPGEPVTAADLLEAGRSRIDSLDAGPEVRVDLLTTLGVLFDKLGHYDRSRELLEQAVRETRTALPADDPATGRALDALGVALWRNGDLEEAERVLTEALEARRSSGAPAIDVATTQGNLAATLRSRGRYDEAAAMYASTIDRLHALSDGDTLTFASELMGLGQVYQFQGRLGEAEKLFRTVQSLTTSARGEDRLTAYATHNLGVVLAEQGRYSEAERAHREAIDLWRRLFPRGHPEITRSYEAIARVAERDGRWTEADSLYRTAIDSWSAVYGADDTHIATIRANQANLRYFAGKFDEAADAYRDGIRIWRASHERRLLAAGLRNLGIIQRERGDYASADTLLGEALELRLEMLGESHPDVAEVHSAMAGLRNEEGRHADAESRARAALAAYEASPEPTPPRAEDARFNLGVAIAAQGRHAEARPVLEAVYETYLETRNEADPGRARAALWLGIVLGELGHPDRARELVRGALPALESSLRPDAPDRMRAERALAHLAR